MSQSKLFILKQKAPGGIFTGPKPLAILAWAYYDGQVREMASLQFPEHKELWSDPERTEIVDLDLHIGTNPSILYEIQ